MYLGTVTGRVVATIKDEALETRTLLLVRRSHDGKTVVAVDSVGAGYGEHVYVCRGREASFAFRPDAVPSDATVVGIVDEGGLDEVGPPLVQASGDSVEAATDPGEVIDEGGEDIVSQVDDKVNRIDGIDEARAHENR